MTVIETRELTKIYKTGRDELRALDQLNLQVQPGEIFGYLGPNGAGKTTTIRLLLDLIRPSAGSATVLGMDAQADSVALHRRIGFLPGELALWKGQTGAQVVRFVADVRGGVDEAYLRQLCERLQLDLGIKVRNYSSGNRRKLGLVLSLMNKPDLLILDEPTGGLDPLMQQIFNEIMHETRAEGRSVFLSSHLLAEVQAICDRVGILRQGKLITVEQVSRLTQVGFRWVSLQLREVGALPGRLDAIDGVSDVSVEDNSLRLRLSGDFDPLLRALQECYVEELHVHEPSLEEIFLAYYGDGGGA